MLEASFLRRLVLVMYIVYTRQARSVKGFFALNHSYAWLRRQTTRPWPVLGSPCKSGLRERSAPSGSR